MAVTVLMGQNGILQVTLDGEMDRIAADIFMQELMPFMEAATTDYPLHMVVYAKNIGKLSARIRQYFTAANRDDRMGFVAIVHPSRRLRVLAKFISKATNKNNISFVTSENEALATIAEQRMVARAATKAPR